MLNLCKTRWEREEEKRYHTRFLCRKCLLFRHCHAGVFGHHLSMSVWLDRREIHKYRRAVESVVEPIDCSRNYQVSVLSRCARPCMDSKSIVRPFVTVKIPDFMISNHDYHHRNSEIHWHTRACSLREFVGATCQIFRYQIRLFAQWMPIASGSSELYRLRLKLDSFSNL